MTSQRIIKQTVTRGDTVYTVHEGVVSGEVRFAVNWTAPGRQGVVGGFYASEAAALRAIDAMAAGGDQPEPPQ